MFPYKQLYCLSHFLSCFKAERLGEKYTPKTFFLLLSLQVNLVTTTSLYTEFSISSLFFRHRHLQKLTEIFLQDVYFSISFSKY